MDCRKKGIVLVYEVAPAGTCDQLIFQQWYRCTWYHNPCLHILSCLNRLFLYGRRWNAVTCQHLLTQLLATGRAAKLFPSKRRFHLNNRETYRLHYASYCNRGTVSAAVSAPHFHSQDVRSYMLKSIHIWMKKYQHKVILMPEWTRMVENWKNAQLPASPLISFQEALPSESKMQNFSENKWSGLE